ncbi:MAG: methylenetetrahydrofolate--tRNA-(uracil(54)-C(5))-methyltransferase (FADH(2)-oxidizing) TrmFO [Janthinobacterium lividum]
MKILNIIGAGLAGSEAAWQAAELGIQVNLYEMRNGTITTHAHRTSSAAELVCSNSFRNDDINSAIGLLHEELRRNGSLILGCADANKLPAGSALAVDRDLFARDVEQALENHNNINIIRSELEQIPTSGHWIVATGPLTSDKLAKQIIEITGEDKLAFFDAIAPIIYKDSIDLSICWFQSRYDKMGPMGTGKDYINCPLNKCQYYDFVDSLLAGEKTEFKQWEKNTPYFNGCLPVEVMAERGRDTLRFGPMKPVGLTNAHSNERPYAVVQLRQDNKIGSLFNMVGFQTKLKYGAQKEIFSMIPGLKEAEFARFGGLHRNTFINSPKLLGSTLELKLQNNVRFAGQITGVEGYVESCAIGLLAGKFAAAEILGYSQQPPPLETALGALLHHITEGADDKTFQPMNINFGLFETIEGRHTKKDRYQLYSQRALKNLEKWLQP